MSETMVETALIELRQMFPGIDKPRQPLGRRAEIRFRWSRVDGTMEVVILIPYVKQDYSTSFYGATLDEAMAQVREWKANQR